jgi:hypothetical protein
VEGTVLSMLMYMLMLVLAGWVGWQIRDLRAERDEDLREAQRGTEWDARWRAR